MSRDEFPIGATLAHGVYLITERIRGSRDRGMYRGHRTNDHASVVISVGLAQTAPRDEQRSRLSLPAPGVAALCHIGPLEHAASASDPVYDGLVELEPAGQPVARSMPIEGARCWRLARQVAECVHQVHDRGLVVGGIRPEYIYATPDDLTFSGLMPRAEQFLGTASRPSYGVPPLFGHLYQAPEQLMRKPASPASDVFSLCATIVHLATGHHPFGGDDAGTQLSSIVNGDRRPRPDLGPLGAVLDRGLAMAPEERPSIADVLGALESAGDDAR